MEGPVKPSSSAGNPGPSNKATTESLDTIDTSSNGNQKGLENESALSSAEEVVDDGDHSDVSSIESHEDINPNEGQFEPVESRNKRRKKKKKQRKEAAASNNSNQPGNANYDNSNNHQPPQNSSSKLYFPRECSLDENQKLQWIAEVNGRGYEIGAKLGRHGVMVVSKNDRTTNELTTTGYKEIILKSPSNKNNFVKVIIKGLYPYLSLDWIKDKYPKLHGLVWNNKSKHRREVIGWCDGKIPDSIELDHLCEPLVIEKYVAKPNLCGKCSKWNHTSLNCHNSPKCRYCCGSHMSTICQEKISNGDQFVPKCPNCFGQHNATSTKCSYHPEHPTLPSRDESNENQSNSNGNKSNPPMAPQDESSFPTPHWTNGNQPWPGGHEEESKETDKNNEKESATADSVIITLLKSLEENLSNKIESLEEKLSIMQVQQQELEERVHQLNVPKESHEGLGDNLHPQNINQPESEVTNVINQNQECNLSLDAVQASVESVMRGHPWPKGFSVNDIRFVLTKAPPEERLQYSSALAALMLKINEFRTATQEIERSIANIVSEV